MYVPPTTNIRLLSGVPCTPDYAHSIYFPNWVAQRDYFISKTKHSLSNQTYQRISNGICRVGIPLADCLSCEYMMFQNEGFSAKWFYAFITSVDYVNNGCTEIRFEIDVLQTWLFDFTFSDCYVVRQTELGDEIGANIEPESMEPGEYIFNSYEPYYNLKELAVIIGISDVDESNGGNTYYGIYSGVELYGYDQYDISGIDAKLADYLKSPDSIVSMYMCPKDLVSWRADHKLVASNTFNPTFNRMLDPVKITDTLGGYKPKNNKLYTYPYNFLHVDNAAGGSLKLRYEFFNNLTPNIAMKGVATSPVKMILYPMFYKGTDADPPLIGESITLDGYPLCQWNIDTYKAWAAQNSLPIAAQVGGSVVGGVAASVINPASIVSNVSGLASQIGSIASQAYRASIGADLTKGSPNNGGVNCAAGYQNFYVGRASVTANRARVIDDYFSAFGYAVRRIAKPLLDIRPEWTYNQLLDVNLIGNLPAQDEKKIIEIFESGVTFWKNADHMGDYWRSNTVGIAGHELDDEGGEGSGPEEKGN